MEKTPKTRLQTALAVTALIAGPVILYYLLPHIGLPKTIVSGVVMLMVFKHLGLLAVVLPSLYAVFRRRSRNRG